MSDQSAELPPDGQSTPNVKIVPVPVYNCPVYVAPPSPDGTIAARCATLPEVTATGATEREALQRIVAQFKAAVIRYRDAGQPIPFLAAPGPPLPGERQRLIAVHL